MIYLISKLIKASIVIAVIVLAMQIQVGNQTLGNRAERLLEGHKVVEYAQIQFDRILDVLREKL